MVFWHIGEVLRVERQRKMYIVTVVLAVLLGVAFLVLAGTFAYSKIMSTATAVAAGNLIAAGGGAPVLLMSVLQTPTLK